MAGRQFFVLTVGLAFAATLALVIADLKQQADFQRVRIDSTAGRIGAVVGFLDAAPQEQLMEILESGAANIHFADRNAESGIEGTPDKALADALADVIGADRAPAAMRVEPDLCRPRPSDIVGPIVDAIEQRQQQVRNDPIGPPPICWLVSFDLSEGRRLEAFQGAPPAFSVYSRLVNPIYIAVLTLAAALLAFLVSRFATGALHGLAKAAAELGDDIERPPLPERGPSEVRAATQAFNHMQARLRSTLHERTQILAAITHDLQTPLTRMRLRVETAPEEMRSRLIADIAAMQALIADGLDLARTTESHEAPSLLDLGSLIESLVEDAADIGHDASYSGGCDVDVLVRVQSLRRCLSNLIDNAIRHGGPADVTCTAAKSGVTICVRDDGPGIPEDKLEAMFEPFTRLEESRSRETGGTGLGLTISRALAKQIGGDLTLSNRPEGGLEARLFLPASLVKRSSAG